MDSFGVYIHVPFCATRCGYCDFNTYTPTEVDSSHAQYLNALERELELAAAKGLPQAETVFIGGGTPSLLGAGGLGRILTAVRDTFGLTGNAEVTTESNPESTSPEYFAGLLEAGFTRVSLGMQSASTPVLKVLDRQHTPGRAVAAAREARAAGFEHVNLDMIYGTPTETDDDVRRTLDAILGTDVDHVSAYSLIVEDGTAMARKIRRGELPAPQEDVYADRYEIIACTLEANGYDWYEVSNWAKPGGECRHNLLYWHNQKWWGAGPGAHSFIGNERFFNVKRPERYAQLLDDDHLPIQATETITDEEAHTEAVMLGLRLCEGIPAGWVGDKARGVVDKHVRAGLLERGERLRVTDAGRLLADGIITDILAAE
ncbi:radical SAM family heme chaperone HemW [Corynebacterium lujinxingii]|uniref:Heme chaperone HemW n=1 Tax=Corynebacterium lujinxingii TaxID=2763010 RepID=A0A7H0JXK1_9CORY|nr:radical SAM family heme chaperone HemW [Corynebacterium lujinxingii]MBC3177792.1 coproporphyrinogen III oxidase [Corynebacterium lujinxingii]NNO09963.1 coproporphyrinogen III oxidase [Corynebacterium lujinxingii]QNP89767.1 coproporphyrinogen III oxidase [Corynebacterium lujinxingii]